MEPGTHQPAEVEPLKPRELLGASGTPRSYRSLSIVIPTYNERDSLNALYDELVAELSTIGVPFELLFIDDGSTDGTAEVIRQLHEGDDRVRYVRFRRNFGKAAALQEGFTRATGDVIVTMDADLQDVPGEVIKLLNHLDEGHDLVSGWKWPRHDPWHKTVPSKVFNWAIRAGTGLELHDVNCGLKAYRKEMVDLLSIYGDMHRYIPVLAHARGFRVGELKVTHRPRTFGKSKYSMGRLGRGFLDFLTVLFLTRYRNRPLHLIGGFGMLMGFAGLTILAYLTILWFAGTAIGGRPLFFLGILLSILSVQFITFGLLAEMVTSFFLERQNEVPIREVLGFDSKVPHGDESTPDH